MGIKSLSLQMIPWCFHMGGVAGQVSCVQMRDGAAAATSDQDRSIKVIKSDGVVKVYHRPINVSDLMVEFPKHLVCRSDSFTIGQKIPALSDKEKLQLGHNYFLLPKHLFQSALSFVAIASFAASSATNYKNALLKTQPFIVRKAPSGSMQIRVSEEFISKLMMQSSSSSDNNNKDDDDHHDNNNNKLCTTAQLAKEYSALVESRQCWKPKLETIRESKRRRSLGSFGIKTRPQQGTTNKATTYKAHQSTKTSTTTHQQQQQQQQQKQIKSSSSSSGSAMAPSSKKSSSSSSSSSKSASSTKSNTSKGSSVASAKKKGKKVNSLVRLIN